MINPDELRTDDDKHIVYVSDVDPDYDLTFTTFEGLIDAIRDWVDANSLYPDDLKITIRMHSMTQQEIDDLPEVEL